MKTLVVLLATVAVLALPACATKQPDKPDTAPVAAGNAQARDNLQEQRGITADLRKDWEELDRLTR